MDSAEEMLRKLEAYERWTKRFVLLVIAGGILYLVGHEAYVKGYKQGQTDVVTYLMQNGEIESGGNT